MTYEETLHYLYTSIPVFQNAGPSAYKPGLGTSIALDDHLGNPHKAYKTIHVAGTNGKGSVSHLLHLSAPGRLPRTDTGKRTKDTGRICHRLRRTPSFFL